jgi:uncharacterized CHY-type Zn-finger protein
MMTILQYMQSESRCAACAAQFNPGCPSYYHRYFKIPQIFESR